MLDLDDPAWAQFRHAGGDASDYPDVLRQLQVAIEQHAQLDEELDESLWDICHQWTTYDSTVAAVPHLVTLAAKASPGELIRIQVLQLIGCASAGIRHDKPDAPPDVYEYFEQSLQQLAPLAAESVIRVRNREQLCSLFGVIAVAQGDNELAGALFELPATSLQCQNCFQFCPPIEALDPFH